MPCQICGTAGLGARWGGGGGWGVSWEGAPVSHLFFLSFYGGWLGWVGLQPSRGGGWPRWGSYKYSLPYHCGREGFFSGQRIQNQNITTAWPAPSMYTWVVVAVVVVVVVVGAEAGVVAAVVLRFSSDLLQDQMSSWPGPKDLLPLVQGVWTQCTSSVPPGEFLLAWGVYSQQVVLIPPVPDSSTWASFTLSRWSSGRQPSRAGGASTAIYVTYLGLSYLGPPSSPPYTIGNWELRSPEA